MNRRLIFLGKSLSKKKKKRTRVYFRDLSDNTTTDDEICSDNEICEQEVLRKRDLLILVFFIFHYSLPNSLIFSFLILIERPT